MDEACDRRAGNELRGIAGGVHHGIHVEARGLGIKRRKHDADAGPDAGHDQRLLAGLANRLDVGLVVPCVDLALARHIARVRRELGDLRHQRAVRPVRDRCRRDDWDLQKRGNAGERNHIGAQLGDSDVLHGQKEAVLMVEQ